MTLSIILAFCVLAFLLLLALLWSSWPGWLKSLLVLAVTALYFQAYQVAHSVLGNPSPDALPPQFVMLAAVVEEPGPKSAGAVYLWVTPIQEGTRRLQPRAYKLPYSRGLHEQVNLGLKKGRDGVSQMGVAELKDGNGLGLGWLNPGNDEQEVKIRDLPVPQLPEK